MNEEDDALLNTLARQQRQQEDSWQTRLARLGLSEVLLERYAANDLSDAEHHDLHVLIAQSEEAASIVAAYTPLGASVQESVLARLEASAGATVGHEGASITALTPRARPKPWRPAIAIPSALAAGLLIFMLLPGLLTGPGPETALPPYVLQVSGMTAQLRANPTDEVRVTPTSARRTSVQLTQGNQLRLLMTPSTQAASSVDTLMYLQLPSQAVPRPLALAPEWVSTSPSGAVRIEARVGDQVRLPLGNSRLFVVVGGAEHLPTASALVKEIGDQAGVDAGTWQAFALDLTVLE